MKMSILLTSFRYCRSNLTNPTFHRNAQHRNYASIHCGNKKNLASLVSQNLNQESLEALFKKQITAIVIPGFLDKKTCSFAAKRILNDKIEEYTNAPGIGRVGISFYETTNNSNMENKYFDEALPNIQAIRSIFSPYQAPIDRLRVTLDEAWVKGAILGIRQEKKMFAGLIRSLEDGKNILPHEDKFHRDDPLELIRSTIKTQAAVNIYLQNPKEGGELELYGLSLPTDEYDMLRKDSYGIERSLLPKPQLRIKPEDGDLVIFNSTDLHAVSSVKGKTRVSISCFIGLKDKESPLTIWS